MEDQATKELIDEQLNEAFEEWESTHEKCDKCKKGLLERMPVSAGYDDYTWLYRCTNCDWRFEE